MPRLVLHPGQPKERVILLAPGTVVVGRTEESSVVVADASLSRKHVRLSIGPTTTTLEDLTSKNGTFIDGQRVTRAVLQGGERLTFGSVEALYQADAQVDLTPAMQTPLTDMSSLTMIDVVESAGHDPQRLRVLLKVSEVLSSPQPLARVLDQILELALLILGADRAAVLVVDDAGAILPQAMRLREGVPASEHLQGAYSSSIAHYVLEHGVAALFADAANDPRLNKARSVMVQSIRASLCAPLSVRGRLLGVLYVDSTISPKRLRQEDVDFLAAFASQAAVAIESSRLRSELEREAVARSNLLRFFPPAVSDQLVRAGEESLGVRETEVTALFCDLTQFTDLSSHMRPREVVDLLNAYFPPMAEAVFRHGGTLEKYIGDAILAVWGAPYSSDDDADRALAAAVDMQRAMQDLADARGEPLSIHVGINSGLVAAGNIGTDRYLQYATIGDTTNVASRVCGVANAHEIVISETTRARLRRPVDWPLEALGPVSVKGKSEPIVLHKLRWHEVTVPDLHATESVTQS